MTKIETKSLPGSLGSLGVAAGFVASQLFLNPVPSSVNERPDRVAPFVDYTLSPSTFGQHVDLFTTTPFAATSGPGHGLEEFYADLLDKQERLGREFEQVLFENLWNLYAR
jgi:hypothetical protein